MLCRPGLLRAHVSVSLPACVQAGRCWAACLPSTTSACSRQPVRPARSLIWQALRPFLPSVFHDADVTPEVQEALRQAGWRWDQLAAQHGLEDQVRLGDHACLREDGCTPTSGHTACCQVLHSQPDARALPIRT